MTLTLNSAAFPPNGEIPVDHTCDGADRAPPLTWTGVPEKTRSLALVVDDPDAPDPAAPKRRYVHWVLFDIPPTVTTLPDGGRPLPPPAREGLNDWQRVGYGGPCPRIGRHRYVFTLYALDTTLDELDRPTKAELEAAVQGHVLASAELVGTYQRVKVGAR